MDPTQQLRSLKRGLQALVLLNDFGLMTVSDLARKLKVPRTTAHRILDTLVAEDYAERVPNSRGYQLTPTVRLLSHGFDDESWIAKTASPLIERLSSEIKWPISLTTPGGASMLVRLCTDHSSPLALVKHRPGFMAPMLGTSAGHVYLAFSNPEQRELTLDAILGPTDPRRETGRERARFDGLLDRIRQDGFMVLEHNEYSEGGIAVPILVEGKPIACLGMRYIKSAMTPSDVVANYLGTVQATALRIGEAFVGETHTQNVRIAKTKAPLARLGTPSAWREPPPIAAPLVPSDLDRVRSRVA
jgi:IclR family mhp operon transcriptional activator